MAVKFSNNFSTTLASSITSTATVLPLATVSGLPTLGIGDYTYLTLDTGAVVPTIEIVKVTAINSGTNEVTVVRAQDGTTASSFAANSKVELRVSAILLNDLSDEASVTLWADVQNKPDPTLTLTGDVTGTVTFTDLGNGSMATTASADLLRVDGDGSNLQDVRAETLEVVVKNVSGGSLAKGTPVHQTGTSGAATFEVVAADASNAALMPAHFVLLETLADEAEGRGLLMGRISGVDTSAFSEGDTIYVAAGGGYTNVAPTGEGNLIQNLGTVTRVDATHGGGEVMGAGRSAATPNLNNGNIFIGNASNRAVTASLATSVSSAGFASVTYVDDAVAPKWTQDNTKIANWDTAYGWGDHASAGYLTGNQTITLTGDVSGSGTTSIAVTIADDSHNHVISNVDGLQTALDAKQNASTALTTSTTFGGDVSGTYNAIVVANDSHTHDGRYYTESQISTFFAGTTAITGYNKSNWDTAYGWGNHASQNYATTSYVNAAVSGLIDAAPATLDTLNELAAALGDDPNFATTISNQIGLKQDAATALTTSTTFGGDVSGTYNAIVVANDSHSHDGRYYTEAESDARFLRSNTSDTLNGALTIERTGRALLITGSGTLDGSDASIYLGNSPSSFGFDITYEGTGSGNTNAFVITSTNQGTPKELLRANQDGIVNLPQSGAKVAGNTIFHDGYHPNADKWTTARTLSLTGAVTGSVSIDGSGNVSLATTATSDPTLTLDGDVSGSATFTNLGNATLTVTVADDSHNHVISNVDGLQAALDAKQDSSTALTTSTTFGGDVSGTYNAIVVANDSHTHAFNNLTAKTSGTGDYKTTGRFRSSDNIVSGEGSGGVALTINDSKGNANVTWNHADGIPEQTGNAARIEVNTDSTTGAAMYFELKSGVTGGASVDLNNIMTLTESAITAESGIAFTGSGSGLTGTASSLSIGGNAATSSKWATARTLSLTGAVTGSASIDGSGNVSLATTATSDPTLTLSGDASGSATFTNLGNATLTVTVANDSHTHDGRYYTESEADSRFVNAAGDTLTGTLNYRLLQSQTTSNYDTAGDASGFSVFYGTSSATSKPSGTDHAVTTLSYSGAWQVQEAADWRTNARYIRKQENGTWSSWQRIFADDYHPNADKWTTARTLSLTGAVTGSASIDGSGNVSLATTNTADPTLTLAGDASGSATFTNLGNATLTVTIADDSHNHVISNVDGLQAALDSKYESGDDISVANITATGYLRGPATFTIDPAAHGDDTGTVVIAGNLQVDGTTTTINSTTVTVDDKNLVLASGAANAAAANGAGISIDGANATILYNATDDEFRFNKNVSIDGWTYINVAGHNLVLESDSSLRTTIEWDQNGTAIWNLQLQADGDLNFVPSGTQRLRIGEQRVFADDYHPNADKWTTARTLTLSGDVSGSVSWDGSANATLTATVANDSHTHSNYVLKAGDTMTGTLSVNNINASLLVGDVTGDSYTEIKHINADGYGFDFQHNNASVVLNQQGTTNQVIVLGDVNSTSTTTLFGISHSTDGGSSWSKKLNFTGTGEMYIGSAGTSRVFHAGYHPNADKWTTARTLSLTGAVTGSASIDGSGNVSLATTATSDPTLTLAGDASGSATFTNLGNATLTVTVADDSHNHVISNVDGLQTALDGKVNNTGDVITGTLEQSYGGTIWSHSEGTVRPVSRLTYSEAGSIGTTGTSITDVYGEADLSAIDNDATFTYAAAWDAVESHGGRLPTLAELMDGVGQGSGQGYDAEYLWTCTPAGPHHVWVARGVYSTTADRQIVDITNASNVYRCRAFFDVSRDGRTVSYEHDGVLRIEGNNRAFHDGYHPNADKWTTARTLSLTGAVTGSASIDGSGNVSLATTNTADPTLTLNGDVSGSATFTNLGNATLTVTVADDSHNHVISNVDGLQAALDGKLSLSGGTMTGDLKFTSNNAIYFETSTLGGFIPFPGGGQYITNSSSHTGAIKIGLPVHGPADMISFYVDVYDYSTNEAFTVFIAGYAYQTTGNNEWVNLTVRTDTTNTAKDFTVRFGGDGSRNCVWIGETTSTWSYPQVTVRDVQVGYTADVDAWADGWSVSFATAFDTVQNVISNNLPLSSSAAKWTTARTLSLSGDASGSVSWDGSANATLSVAVANDSHTHDGRYFTESESDGRYLRRNAEGGTVDVNAANGTQLFIGSTNNWTNRGPSGNNAGALLSINTHPGNYYSQFWFNTAGGAVYHRTANNTLPTATWQRLFADDYHPNADKWTTARTITLGGDLTGSVSIDGSANATLTAALAWNTSDTFNGTYSLAWNASDDLYTASWLQVRGSDDSLLTRNIVADGYVDASGGYKESGSVIVDSSKRFYVGGGSIQHSSRISFLDGSNGNTGSGAQGIAVQSLYAGTSYSNTAPSGMVNALNGYQVGNTTVIDSSRNVSNVNLYRFTQDNFGMYVSPTNTNTLNGMWGQASDTGDLWINYRGYQDGTTYFRDFRIGDGKNKGLVHVDGSAADINIGYDGRAVDLNVVSGNYQVNGTTVIDASRNLTNIGTISSGAITTTGINLLLGTLDLRGDVALDHDGNSLYIKSPDTIYLYPSNALKGYFNPSFFWWGEEIRIGSSTGATNQTGIIKENGSTFGLGLFTWGDSAPVWIGGSAVNLRTEAGAGIPLQMNGTTVIDSSRNLTNIGTLNGGTPWHSANDGSGSGLDADLLDGLHETSFVRTSTGVAGNLDTVYRAGMFGWSPSATGNPNSGYGQGVSIVSSGDSHNNSNNWITQLGFGTDTNTAYFRGKTNSNGWGSWYSFFHTGNLSTGADTRNFGTLQIGGTTVIDSSRLIQNANMLTAGYLRITGNTALSNTTNGLFMDGNYTDGRYRHRWRKQDVGGGVPLILDYAAGTANSYGLIARFGPYTGNPENFEVYGSAKMAGLTVDGGTNTTVDIISDDNGKSLLRLIGGSQGTGQLYVGQSQSYGGGIEYNGDGSPTTTGAGADYVTLYRRSQSVENWTARNFVNDNDWQFRGNVTAYASDARLKENVTTITNALEKVQQLRGVEFDWKDECESLGFIPSMKHETGVIAQEVQAVIPDAAVPAPFNNDYLTVHKDKIVPLLIEAIKEQQEQIDELKALIKEMKNGDH